MLLGIFALLLLIVSVLLTIVTGLSSGLGISRGPRSFVRSSISCCCSAGLVAPALGGNTINGDRDTGTLATTQITLITTPQLVLGKFVAAWLSALAFLVVALPFLLYSQLFGGTPVATIVISLLILAAELGVISAVGVGLSGMLRRPLFSSWSTYLVVATLSVGTLIGFGLGGLAFPVQVTATFENYSSSAYDSSGKVVHPVCDPPTVETSTQPSYDKLWGILAANPYVVLADAVPGRFDARGEPARRFRGDQGRRAERADPGRAVLLLQRLQPEQGHRPEPVAAVRHRPDRADVDRRTADPSPARGARARRGRPRGPYGRPGASRGAPASPDRSRAAAPGGRRTMRQRRGAAAPEFAERVRPIRRRVNKAIATLRKDGSRGSPRPSSSSRTAS